MGRGRKICKHLLNMLTRNNKVTKSHNLISEKRLINGLTITEIESHALLHSLSEDQGYHKYGNNWWSNKKCPYAFQYLKVDDLYSSEYFDSKVGHPASDIASDLYAYMQEIFLKVFNRKFISVLELGSGGGEITGQFQKENLDFIAVEGTKGGVAQLLKMGMPKDKVVHENLKFMKPLGRKFDLVMCTEVVEHIEAFFASKIVENCITHSDVVWFSVADRNRRAHYHHMNEQDIEAFDNLFAHMGFKRFIKLDGRHSRASRMYFADNLTLPDSN